MVKVAQCSGRVFIVERMAAYYRSTRPMSSLAHCISRETPMGNFCILKTIIVLIWREFGTKILFSINQSIRVALKAELLQGYDKMSKSDDDVRT